MKYGYIRPTVEDQQSKKQLLTSELDKIYRETHGLAKKRIELENLLMIAHPGDELFIQNIEVLADSLQQLLDILRLAERDQITIHFIDEQITNKTIQTSTLLKNVEYFTELQSTFFSHSSTFSLQAAKQQGKLIGRPRISDDNLQRAFTMYDSKCYSLYEIKEETGISKSTLYRYLDERATQKPDDKE
ncbi:resolvase [Sporosarcina sp. P13]|uniref:recombinase family protein n=1 Tax=Sporosarcina sp. P13 TaxID=2048263 RepID=UPI000C16B7E8|nr:recombinase family protein [Sporosarcina sp. P13]PIC64868.1 resolvase [Sporosarcina sp. P13]